MRSFISVVISILSFIILKIAFAFLSYKVGVELELDNPYPSYCGRYECGDHTYTIYGSYVTVICAMLSFRIYMIVDSGKLDGDLSFRSRLSWRYTIYWLTTLIIVVYVLDLVAINIIVRIILELVLLFVISNAYLKGYEKKARLHDMNDY